MFLSKQRISPFRNNPLLVQPLLFLEKKSIFFYCQIRESQFPTFVKGVGAVRTMPWLDFLENEGDSRKPKKVEELV